MQHRSAVVGVSMCLFEMVSGALPARASHAYTMTCCNVPSSITAIDRTTHQIQTLIAGQGAAHVAATADNKTLYVANENDSSISVLNGSSTIAATISLSSYGASPYGLVLSPDGSQLYVTAAQGLNVSVLGISTLNNSVLFDVVTPGFYLSNLSPIPAPPPVISPDGLTVYILASEFIMFNTSTLGIQTIPIPSGVNHPEGVAITPDGAFAAVTFNEGYFLAPSAGQLALLDLKANTLVKQISYPYSTTVGAVAVSPDSKRAYFPLNSLGNASIAVFNIAAERVTNDFPVGSGYGLSIAITPDGSEIELGESNALVVSVQASTGAITAQVSALGAMTALSVSPDGARIYVPNCGSSMIEVIDPRTSEVSNQIPGGWLGLTMFDTNFAFTASENGRSLALAGIFNVTFVDTVNQRVVGAVSLPGNVRNLALSPNGELAYLVFSPPSGGPDQIQVINTLTLQVVGSLTLTSADQPDQSAVSPDGSTLYMSEQNCPDGGSCLPELLAVDTASLQVSQAIVLSTEDFSLGGVAIGSNGKTAYVEGLPYSGGVSIVDLVSGQVTATIVADFGFTSIALSPDQKYIYEPAQTNYGFYLIDLTAMQSTGIVGGTSQCLGLSLDGQLLYLGAQLSSALAAWSTQPENSPVFLNNIALPGGTDSIIFAQF